ncbi:Glutamyl-tRNA(Gln) amidotransferase subunit A [Geodia barretti]|uniref:Glutamyl-tRNA(Gln) amidotransferase subunit A n=2 Tax=Geodia barretti TaxID=519541 RepID=A0AA35RME2_GEOBA|nr:Glutamyl-tRNA(Gln) amidotransferase subunit A [Geodia barretti]
MAGSELPLHSASALAGLIESREASPVEVVEAYLQRIDDLDFKFNSFITVLREQALEEARQAEREILAGNYRGPMHGIPVGIKDQIWTKDIRTTGGSRILADFVPDDDATVIANLRNAGAILLGKTNLTEFAVTGFTHRFSTPRNPWDLNISAGGSSSGSGAATAAFLCATSLGEDTGGSIRRPAAWCGIVGLRPGWGRVSRYGLMRGVWSMDTIGPISRTVEDAAITLSAIAGYDPKDPTTWNTPVPDYRQALHGDIRGLRVGILTELLHSDMVEPDVADAVAAAADTLAELGADVEEVSIPLAAHANAIAGALLAVEPALNMKEWVRERLHDFGHDNRIGLLTGSLVPAQAYQKAQKLRALLREDVLAAFRTYDVLVMPTSGRQAVPIQDDPPVTSRETSSRLPFMRTNTFNLSSAPAISVPCGFGGRGLPVGLQIAGPPGGEEMVFRLAHAYEQNTPWHTMRPPSAEI